MQYLSTNPWTFAVAVIIMSILMIIAGFHFAAPLLVVAGIVFLVLSADALITNLAANRQGRRKR